MNYLTIAIIILSLNTIPLFINTRRVKRDAYQWWYIPWLSFLYVVLMYVIFHQTNVISWPGFNLLTGDVMIQTCYVLFCHVLWLFIALTLRRLSLHKSLIPLFRKGFAGDREDAEKVLPFPYFIDHENITRARVGKVFYTKLLGSIIFLVALVYAICFILMHFTTVPYLLVSSFGLLALLPLSDYYLYLKAEVPEEELAIQDVYSISSISDLEKLWNNYVKVFSNYSVAWKRSNSHIIDVEKDNRDQVENLLQHLTEGDASPRENGFLENSDLTQAFLRIEPLLTWEEQNGWLVLITIDIPNHFNNNTQVSYLDEIAKNLKVILHGKELTVFDEYTSDDVLNSSIVVASLNNLTQRNIKEESLKRIGLVVVINQLDKSVSNLYECRKFSYLLDSMNNNYQMLFITPHFRGVEPALKNIWHMKVKTIEKRMKQLPQSFNQFFIGYNFEDYLERYKCIMPSLPGDPLSAISEMAPMALSYKVGDNNKTITPVHFFDLAYTNIIEGNEELINSYKSQQFPVKGEDFNKHIFCHQLPIETIDEPQIFSVIFDQENNAPAAYNKWIHLGRNENFSVVISKPYMFRDYFNANHGYFVNMPFIALQPHPSKSRVTLAVILLNILQKASIEEQQLRGLLLGYYNEDEIQSLSGTVQQLFKSYFSSDLAGRLRTNHTIDFNGSKYLHKTTYELDYADAVNLSYLDYISVKDESDNVLFGIMKDLMSQNFVEGQIHSFLGKPYQITRFEEDNKVLRVKAANTQAINVIFYKPVQIIKIDKNHSAIEDMKKEFSWYHPITGQRLGLDFDGFETQVNIQVNRWYAFNRYSILDCSFSDVNPPTVRSYHNGRVLKVSFRYLKKEKYINRIDDIRKGLQILIYEAMQSVFPHHAQYLIISSLGEGDANLPWIFNQCICEDKEDPGTISFFFSEDAHVDLGLIGALANKDVFGADYLFRYIYDYLLWLTEGNPAPAGNYAEYLYSSEMDKTTFLKYGIALPTYFDIDLLINFIRDFFCEGHANVLQGVTERNNRQDVFGICDFCRSEEKNSDMQRLGDGRMRCDKCSENAVDSEIVFNSLVNQVKEAFKTHLGIDFNTIKYKARLVSAVELHKSGNYSFSITNGYDVRKIIGLAFDHDGQDDSILVENGYKPDKTFGIIAHEMTHIWEYNDDDFKKIRQTNEDLAEGLAVWTDLFLSEKHGIDNIEELRNSWLSRTDEYGRGLKFILENCPKDPYGYIRAMANK